MTQAIQVEAEQVGDTLQTHTHTVECISVMDLVDLVRKNARRKA